MFSKSFNNSNPGISFCSVYVMMSQINQIFSPIYHPVIKPVWSVSITLSRTLLIIFAIHPDAILYVQFNRVKGRQFFNNSLDLFGLGIHVIMPSF